MRVPLPRRQGRRSSPQIALRRNPGWLCWPQWGMPISATFLSVAALRQQGLKKLDITRLVSSGTLIRARQGPVAVVSAARLGVRLDCIEGVGRVDFVVDGWLIIECDSRAHPEGWAKQKRDRERDLAAAALGYTTIRPIAEDIFGRPGHILEQIRRALASRLP